MVRRRIVLLTWIKGAMQLRHRLGSVKHAIEAGVPGRSAEAAEAEVRELRVRVEELERDSLTDRLTGAWNRRYLDKLMPGELTRSRRHRQPLSVVLLDIDNFKHVNDVHGHLAGDAVLRELAELTRANLRVTDAMVRWGGEEFLIIMPQTSHAAATIAAEKLRQHVAAHPFPGAGRITVSLGVAEYAVDEDMDTLFRRVDDALYRAKEGGRDRVVADARGASDAWSAGRRAIVQLVWRENYACGEPTIDAQHEELFRLANVLLEASLRQEEDRPRFAAALERLLAHLPRHFEDEERILAAHAYPKLEAHRAAHHGLLRRAATLKEAALRGEATTGTLVEFLAGEVVTQHLLGADRDFYPLFFRPG